MGPISGGFPGRGARTALRAVGAHLEALVRGAGHAQGLRTPVASGTPPDPAHKTGHELDLVVFGRTGDGRERVLALGEAKSSDTVGRGHLPRLEQPRELLVARWTRGGPLNFRIHALDGVQTL
ncbi:hypothetical protein KGA66_20255 [Actinocrinis puniceicyclus]|uniref:Uncharacterized protein n=1 Tax=Actinocrinis puniceicyclus TaxID=977794 RepID=A0A8J8BEC8_9ACTN|nr:hypothetical protein [Actinocrinis puniceicyclus]MBS2965395.1 hypothetical protein [Actinocrinis puniceicyclus]